MSKNDDDDDDDDGESGPSPPSCVLPIVLAVWVVVLFLLSLSPPPPRLGQSLKTPPWLHGAIWWRVSWPLWLCGVFEKPINKKTLLRSEDRRPLSAPNVPPPPTHTVFFIVGDGLTDLLT